MNTLFSLGTFTGKNSSLRGAILRAHTRSTMNIKRAHARFHCVSSGRGVVNFCTEGEGRTRGVLQGLLQGCDYANQVSSVLLHELLPADGEEGNDVSCLSIYMFSLFSPTSLSAALAWSSCAAVRSMYGTTHFRSENTSPPHPASDHSSSIRRSSLLCAAPDMNAPTVSGVVRFFDPAR